MNVNEVIREEANRILRKPKYSHFGDDIKVVGYQFDENFTSVMVKRDKSLYLGHAKCNPRADSYDERRGLTIALARAIDSAVTNENRLEPLNEKVYGK